MTRRISALALLAVTIPVGLLWRHLPLPLFLWKYGGSVLWTLALYLTLVVLLPRVTPAAISLLAAIISINVELSRLLHNPALESFRQTLPGRLLLGRYFSMHDIAAYWLAIAALCLFDNALSTRTTKRT
jgi:hypothetical protein